VPPPPGRVAVVNAGTELHATLKNSLDSSTTQEGEPVEATLAAPFSSGCLVLFPAGSKFVGSVTNVVSAYRTRFTATGKIDIKFTSVETPDGRKFTVDASVDNTKQQLGAAPAAGSTGNGVLGRAAGLTAAFGSGLGSGLDASMRRPAEIRIKAGTSLPVKLNQNLQIATAAAPAMPPPGYVPPAYPPQYGAYPPPQQGYPAPQQQPPYYPQPQQ
jgi:hypothetical protein